MRATSASARLAKAAWRATARAGVFGKAWALPALWPTLLLILLLTGVPLARATTPTPPGTIITNTATLTWSPPVGSNPADLSRRLALTTTQLTPVLGQQTSSSAGFLAYAPGSGAPGLPAGPTQCLAAGVTQVLPTQVLPPPVSPQGTPLDPDTALPLGPAQMFYPGDPVFVQVVDADQNRDPALRERVTVTVSVVGTSQTATLSLSETGPDTGVFVGYVPTTDDADQSSACMLWLAANQQLQLDYQDAADAGDNSSQQVLVSPLNKVFDSVTGAPVDGVTVQLVDAASGAPAAVLGRDGVSHFPSSVVSGQAQTDASGAHYDAASGTYLLPTVAPGRYRLLVTPPAGYRFGSTVSIDDLQKLDGAPFVLGPVSFGQSFTLDHAQAVGFDIPLDPISTQLFVHKSVSMPTASVGDMLQFTLVAENGDKTIAAQNVRLLDTLPAGLRYVAGSTRIDGAKAADPLISADGRQLEFAVGRVDGAAKAEVTYITAVSAATPLGTAVNRVQGFAEGGTQSNVATASVQIQSVLMQDTNTVIGRVLIGCDKDAKPAGMAGVRVLMETGTYAISDKDGRFHFEDVSNGTHVVQLDQASLPPGYEPALCKPDSRHAGRAYSQFVELHGGALWRTDFHVRPLPAPQGKVTLTLSQSLTDDTLHSRIALAVDTVAISNASVSVVLPTGASYVIGSASIDGAHGDDPSSLPGVLVFRLGDRAAGWHGKIDFDLKLAADATQPIKTQAMASFDAPSAKHQRTPAVSVTLDGPGSAQATPVELTTLGLPPSATQGTPTDIPGQSDAGTTATPADDFALDIPALGKAGPTPAIVWPQERYNPSTPSIHVAVKHAADEQAVLQINGEPVSSRNVDGVIALPGHKASVTKWLAIPVREGDNVLGVEIRKHGRQIAHLERHVHYAGMPVRAEVVPQKSVLIADGKTRPRLAVRLYDRWGKPVREGLTGKYAVLDPYQPYQSLDELQNHQLLATAPRQPSYVVGKDGIAMLVLAPTTQSGQLVASIPLQNDTHADLRAWMEAGKRDWILVGVASGTLAFNTIKGHLETLDGNDPHDDLLQDGRVAFYAKGMIKGKYLLTLAYDTARRNNIEANGLEREINPDQNFMLYGDASQQGYDADSASKLYLKIERGRFNAMFGNFDTGLSVTELSRYQRRFNGIKSQFDGKHFGYVAFAARNAQSYVHDEIQGNGTSGLYHLSHAQIILNSEQIRLETRDRFHSENVLATQTLSRFLDYTIDTTTGAIFFKAPVAAVDENFNPVYIVAEYEVPHAGGKSLTAGGRAAVKFNDGRVEVGVTAVDEGSEAGHNRLTGADLRVEIGKATELKAEIAHTRNGSAGTTSTVGGYSPGSSRTGGSSTTGSNSHASGTAFLVDLKHHGEKLESELYLRQLGVGFGLGQQSMGEAGMRKVGGTARYRISKTWSLKAEAYKQMSLAQHTARSAADVAVNWQDKGNSVIVGVRHVADESIIPDVAGALPATTPAPVGTSISTSLATPQVDARANGDTNQVYLGGSTALLKGKLTLHGQTAQSIGGNTSAYPDQTQIGADYQINPAFAVYINQQFADLQHAGYSHMTEVGVRASPWNSAKLESSLGQQMTEYGPRTFATSGLTQQLPVSKTLTLSFGLNVVKSLRSPDLPAGATGTGIGGGMTGGGMSGGATGSGTIGNIGSSAGTLNAATPPVGGFATEDYTSGFVGATWRRKDWSLTSRVETLRSKSQKRLGVLAGFYRDLSGGKALSASLNAFDTSLKTGGRSSNADLRFGFAMRPDGSNWSWLEQLDFIYANQQSLSGSLFLQQGSTGGVASQTSPDQLVEHEGERSTLGINQRSWKAVNNLQLNYTGDRAQWSFYYGLKYASYAFDSGTWAGFTDLIGGEFRYDLNAHWDIGIIGSRLHTWSSGVSKNSLGLELGRSIGHNTWLSVGYNFLGFHDQDFSAAHYTAKGVFLRLRMKFDQDTLRDMLGGDAP